MSGSEVLVWTVAFVVLMGILGLIIGSFLNVVVYRVPAGKSIVHPPSACPNCGAHIRGYDNVPVVSWLLLRGKCRDCGNPISWRYPVVELATGMFFAGVALWRIGSIGDAFYRESAPLIIASMLELVAFLFLASISVALFLIDIDTKRLPNAIVLPSYIIGAVLLSVSGILSGDLTRLLVAATGGAALFVFYFILAIAKPGGMGMGDVKLAGVLGIFLGWVGWGALIVGAFSAFLLGGVFSIILLLAQRAGRRTAIPFGPWMLVGAWVGILFGERIAGAYLALIGLN